MARVLQAHVGRVSRPGARVGAARLTEPFDRETRNVSRQGECEEEGRPLPQPAFDAHLAAMRLDDMFDDGQPQPRAALLARAGFVHAVKTLEQTNLLLGRDPRPLILDGEVAMESWSRWALGGADTAGIQRAMGGASFVDTNFELQLAGVTIFWYIQNMNVMRSSYVAGLGFPKSVQQYGARWFFTN